jgi:hypothetical protein
MSAELRSDLAELRVNAEKRRKVWQYYAGTLCPASVPRREWIEQVKKSSDTLTRRADAAATRVLELLNDLDEQCRRKEASIYPFTRQIATTALAEAKAEIRALELGGNLHSGSEEQLLDWYNAAQENNKTNTSELATVEHHIALLALMSSKLRTRVPLNVPPEMAVSLGFGVVSEDDLQELRVTNLIGNGKEERFLDILKEWSGHLRRCDKDGCQYAEVHEERPACVQTGAGIFDLEALPSLEATWARVVKMAAYHPTLGEASSEK